MVASAPGIEKRPRADEPPTVRQVSIPPAARAVSTLSRVDYADGFLLRMDPADSRTAEQWARATLEDTPISTQRALRRGWFALGLKLGQAAAERAVLGWEIRRSDPDSLLLAAGSRIGMPAELVFQRERDTLLLATFVEHRNPIARALWAMVAPSHRQIVPRLLKRAAGFRHP